MRKGSFLMGNDPFLNAQNLISHGNLKFPTRKISILMWKGFFLMRKGAFLMRKGAFLMGNSIFSGETNDFSGRKINFSRK
jgi:hypothetical protein